MKAIIVEDSRLARLELKELLKAHSEITVVDEAKNVQEALEKIEAHSPDVIFLDIDLPGGTGFDLLERLEVLPQVIFTTAYDRYALQAFDVNAIDYLLKPINPEYLKRAIDKLGNTDTSQETNDEESAPTPLKVDNKIFVKDGTKCWLIAIGKIRYFSSSGNHAQIFFEDNKPFVYKALSEIEKRLDESVFIRVSRQYIVNLNNIAEVSMEGANLQLVMDDGKEISVSRRYTSKLRNALSL